MGLTYRILVLQTDVLVIEGTIHEWPTLPGFDVMEQLPGEFTASGRDVIPAPPEATNKWTVEHKATFTRIPGTDDYVVFADDFSEIDPDNKGETVLQYGRDNWPWWNCEISFKDEGGKDVVAHETVTLDTVPADDASVGDPWTANGKNIISSVHSLPGESMAGMIDIIEQAPIK